ncbi:hypothetical protein GE061_006354 [Apolygus lucorum]|uniref:Peptidase M20 dimerisation domain-containing protein n=1 Tax=Apolygus lucorum TaxID=248454 RepID=A0A8S9WV16_APOLU|nr:hypothetical protein GE061_006354 [Apolygus lucorum]
MIPKPTEESFSEVQSDLDRVFDLLVEKCEFLLRRLRDFVAFPTVSLDPSKKLYIQEMAEYLVEVMKKFSMTAYILPMTFEEMGTELHPPLVLAESEMDPGKRTVCFYGHFDVRPIILQDYWYGDPFVLTGNNDATVFWGKGTSLGKGPLLCLINAIGAYRQLNIPLPINIKIVMDPMGLANEELTGKFLKKTSLEFFRNVDFVCLLVGQWFGNMKPCVSHGSRGLCYFNIEIEGANKDLDSGCYGGLLNEPMTDLVYLMDQLVDKRGNIKINDIYEDVVPVTNEDKEKYKNVNFVVRHFKQLLGAPELLVNEDKKSLLVNMWRMPSLTIHGIEGAFSNPGVKNVIPGHVIGKFSIHIVPNMTPSKVKKKVFDYLKKIWKARKSGNRVQIQMTIGKLAWYTDPNDVNCVAAINAIKCVYNEEPDLVRNSNRVRMANPLRRVTNATVIGIPFARPSDVADANAEKIDIVNYVNGCKTLAAYFQEISALSPKPIPHERPKCTCKATSMADCNCYLKSTWEGEEEEEDNSSSTLGDSVCLMSSSGSAEGRVEEPPATRFYSHSCHVRKKIEALNKLICDGELLIGMKRSKDTMDSSAEQAGEDDDSGLSIQNEPLSASAPPAKSGTFSTQAIIPDQSSRSVRLQDDKASLSSNIPTMEMATNYGFEKKQKTLTGKLSAEKPPALAVKKPGLRGGVQNSLSKLGLNVKDIMKSVRLSVGSADKIARSRKSTAPGSSGTVQKGYVGKKPFNLSALSSKALEEEPFGIISSLSALLNKRRENKMANFSTKTLPVCNEVPSHLRIPRTSLPKTNSPPHGVAKPLELVARKDPGGPAPALLLAFPYDPVEASSPANVLRPVGEVTPFSRRQSAFPPPRAARPPGVASSSPPISAR